MRNEDKEQLSAQTQKKYLWLRFRNGCKSICEKTPPKIIMLLFYPAAILIWILLKNNLGLEDMPLVSPVLFVLVDLLLPTMLVGGTFIILVLFGHPSGLPIPKTSFAESV